MTNETMTTEASESAISTPAQHTPGPWTYHYDTFDGGLTGSSIAVLSIYDKNMRVVAGVPGQNHANARLIAAAPDMLAALQNALEHCEREGGGDVEFIRDDKSGHMLNVGMIRAAIAKATQP